MWSQYSNTLNLLQKFTPLSTVMLYVGVYVQIASYLYRVALCAYSTFSNQTIRVTSHIQTPSKDTLFSVSLSHYLGPSPPMRPDSVPDLGANYTDHLLTYLLTYFPKNRTHHHHERAPGWSVSVSTSCLHRSLSWASRHADLSRWRSAFRVRSQV